MKKMNFDFIMTSVIISTCCTVLMFMISINNNIKIIHQSSIGAKNNCLSLKHEQYLGNPISIAVRFVSHGPDGEATQTSMV